MIEEIPENSTLLVIGPPGVGKLGWILDVATRTLNRNENVVFVTLDLHPDEVRTSLLDFGAESDQVNNGNLIFIDGYSAVLALESQPPQENGVLRFSSLSSIGELSELISSSVDELGKPTRIFFYSLSSLFLYNSVHNLAKFFKTLSSRIRTEYGFGAFILQQGVHEDDVVSLFTSLVDGVIQLRFNDLLEREWRVHHMKGVPTSPEWESFEFNKSGLEPNPRGTRMAAYLLDYEFKDKKKGVASQ